MKENDANTKKLLRKMKKIKLDIILSPKAFHIFLHIFHIFSLLHIFNIFSHIFIYELGIFLSPRASIEEESSEFF